MFLLLFKVFVCFSSSSYEKKYKLKINCNKIAFVILLVALLLITQNVGFYIEYHYCYHEKIARRNDELIDTFSY